MTKKNLRKSIAASMSCIKQMHAKRGKYYEKWKQGVEAAKRNGRSSRS